MPGEQVVEAHGSFATQRCIDCKKEFDGDKMIEHVDRGDVPRCEDLGCQGLVKPDIVFFGESLPKEFDRKAFRVGIADLVLVIGTSLSVYPFAALPEQAQEGKPRVLFNLERVGNMGSRADDVMQLGDCDAGIRKLADALGWRQELEQFWEGVVGEEEAHKQRATRKVHDAEVEDEVDKLTKEVESALNFEEAENPSQDKDGATAHAEQATDALESKPESAEPSKKVEVEENTVKTPESVKEEKTESKPSKAPDGADKDPKAPTSAEKAAL